MARSKPSKPAPATKQADADGKMPNRCCLMCGEWFVSWTNYTHVDCVACLRRQGVPIVDSYAVPYAPPRYVRETSEQYGPITPTKQPKADKKRKATR